MSAPTRLFPVLFMLAATFYLGASPRRAAAQTEIPKEVLALFDDLSDIDKLRVLNPLKLTEEQLGKIIDTLTQARDKYVKSVSAAAVPPIRDMAAEIKELRKKLLTGGDVPSDFDSRVKKIQDDFVARRQAEENRTLKSLSDSIRAILTQAQIDKAVSLAKSLTKKNGRETLKGSDEQFFNFYVKGTFMDYGGIIALLEDMKKARGSGAAQASVKSHADRTKVARR